MTEIFSPDKYLQKLKESRRDYHKGYYAMYSSILGGIVTDPIFMNVPLDDHLVHRGDGIFETFLCVNGNIYNLAGHLARLHKSAEMLSFKGVPSNEVLTELFIDTVRAGKHKDCTIRLFVSRGPGSFDVNPYDSEGPQVYVSVGSLKRSFMEIRPGGATVMRSAIPAKDEFFAKIKSCNYMQNVLMKQESVDRGVDFVVSFDERGFMAEGATENMGIVDASGALSFPKLDNILAGTTMNRVIELAEKHAKEIPLEKVLIRDISHTDIESASEMLIVGTSRFVVSVKSYEGRTMPVPGPVGTKLNKLLLDDFYNNSAMHTPVFS